MLLLQHRTAWVTACRARIILGQMFPGLMGRQGHTADTRLLLPPCQESDTTLANGLLLQPPGKSLPWGLCSVALKGDPAMLETRSFWPHLRPAESETLFLKISGGFSVSLPKMFLPQHPSHPSSPPSSLFSDLTFSTRPILTQPSWLTGGLCPIPPPADPAFRALFTLTTFERQCPRVKMEAP